MRIGEVKPKRKGVVECSEIASDFGCIVQVARIVVIAFHYESDTAATAYHAGARL